ncbi:hypothetical protein PVAP13_7NG339624 [Panicum virgatum]|uniref:Uncharacterized protein n=1 Tax=Panicum virgatum TaxID=38727 RepID=A0A8T0Q0X0_PANVG|nr:hypothetical protein PVAP13_7NG339624 [Panicum virgatum]
MGEGLLRQLRDLHPGPGAPGLNAGAGGLRGGVHGPERALPPQLLRGLPRRGQLRPGLRLRRRRRRKEGLLLRRVRHARLPAAGLRRRPCRGAGLREAELSEAPRVQRGGGLLRLPQQGEDGGEPQEPGPLGRAAPLAQRVRAQARRRAVQGHAHGHRHRAGGVRGPRSRLPAPH